MQRVNFSFCLTTSTSSSISEVESFTNALTNEMGIIGFERQGELGLTFSSSFTVVGTVSAFDKYSQVLTAASLVVGEYPSLFSSSGVVDKCHLDVAFEFPTCQW